MSIVTPNLNMTLPAFTDRPDARLFTNALMEVDAAHGDINQFIDSLSAEQVAYLNAALPGIANIKQALDALSTNKPNMSSGEWAPIFKGGITPGVNVYSAQQGSYWRIGDLVALEGAVNLQTKDPAMSGNLLVGGLPFPAASAYFCASIGSIYNITLASDMTLLGLYTQYNTTDLAFYQNVPSTSNPIDSSSISNGAQLRFSLMYAVR